MISNFAGINEIEDLPAEYLSTIYDEISQSEIKMKGGGKDSKTAAAGKDATDTVHILKSMTLL